MEAWSDIEDLVSKLKQRGSVVQDPLKVRRKRKKAIARPRLYVGSQKQRDDARKADRRYWRTVSGRWREVRKEQLKRGMEWSISLQEWKALWQEAGVVEIGTTRIPVFLLRGRQKGAARLMRIDGDKGWHLNNVVVMYKGAVMANGRKLCTTETNT